VTNEQDHFCHIPAGLHPHVWCSCMTLERGVTFPACPCAWHARGASPACAGLRLADRALQARQHSSAPRPPAAALAAAAWHVRLAGVPLLARHPCGCHWAPALRGLSLLLPRLLPVHLRPTAATSCWAAACGGRACSSWCADGSVDCMVGCWPAQELLTALAAAPGPALPSTASHHRHGMTDKKTCVLWASNSLTPLKHERQRSCQCRSRAANQRAASWSTRRSLVPHAPQLILSCHMRSLCRQIE
jgi:hypothetical protein